MRSTEKRRCVLVVASLDQHYLRTIVTGIAGAPERQAGGWELVLAPPAVWTGEMAIPAWRPDGIIAISRDLAAHRALAAWGLPLVELANLAERPADVRAEDAAIAQVAVDHVLGRGYQGIAIAFDPAYPDHPRTRAFLAAARARGVEPMTTALAWPDPRRHPLERVADLASWLRAQRHPLALICHNDEQALGAATACRLAGLEVPDQVGLLGCDDDPLFTRAALVPLSSVAQPRLRIGARAAARLAALMAGRDPGPSEVLPPDGVVERASTALERLADDLVVRALAWIATHRGEAIGVATVAAALGVGRRTLERRMRTVRHSSVLAEIQRQRVAHARQLMAAGATVAAAAAATGLAPSTLYERFRRHFGTSPKAAERQGARLSSAPRRRR